MRQQSRRLLVTSASIAAALAVVVAVLASGVLHRGLGQAPSISAAPWPDTRASATPSLQATSTPGQTVSPAPMAGWTTVELAGISVQDIEERDRRLFAAGYREGESLAAAIVTSEDRLAWSPVDLETLALGTLGMSWISFLASGDPGLVAIGARYAPDQPIADPFILFSPDGLAWEEVPDPEHCAMAGDPLYVELGFVAPRRDLPY